MKSSASNIRLTSVDDLFKTDEGRADDMREKVIDIPIGDLHPFKSHPFQVKDLKEHHRTMYASLLMSGKLNQHLAKVDMQSHASVSRLVKEMARRQGVDEAMKARNQMAWVGAMNAIKAQAEEIALAKYVYR